MSAHPLQFCQLIQEPLDQGQLTPHQAWILDWELTVLAHLPEWSPQALPIHQRVKLFHQQLPTRWPN